MTKIVPRADWGARRPKYINKGNLSEPSTGHWNGPKVTVKGRSTWDHQYCASLVRGIQNFHMDSRGWSDIAYNFLVCPHDYIFEGRGLNVINGANGTSHGNRSSHAICSLAGQGNDFPEGEKRAFKYCVAHIARSTNAPDNRAIGHRDHKSTECPGSVRYNWIHAGMRTSTPAPTPAPTPTPTPPVKGKKKMFSFLFRTTKEIAVWLVSGDMMTKQWVQSPEELEGFKAILKMNGGNDGVCSLHSTEPMSKAIAQIPAVGKVPEGYKGPRVS